MCTSKTATKNQTIFFFASYLCLQNGNVVKKFWTKDNGTLRKRTKITMTHLHYYSVQWVQQRHFYCGRRKKVNSKKDRRCITPWKMLWFWYTMIWTPLINTHGLPAIRNKYEGAVRHLGATQVLPIHERCLFKAGVQIFAEGSWLWAIVTYQWRTA